MNEKPLILRTSPWMPILGWVILGILIGEPIVRGYWSVVIAFGPGVLLIAWLLYVVFWAPCIEAKRAEIVVHNIFRSTYLPYRLIDDITVGALVRIRYSVDGQEQSITSWNAPGRTRPKLPKSPKDATSQARQSGPSEALLPLWFDRLDEENDLAIRTTTHWVNIAITLALTGWLLIAYLMKG